MIIGVERIQSAACCNIVHQQHFIIIRDKLLDFDTESIVNRQLNLRIERRIVGISRELQSRFHSVEENCCLL